MTQTDPDRASPAARGREAYFEAVVNAFDGLVYVCSPDNCIEFANRQAIDYVGRNPVGEKCHNGLYGLDDICPWCVEQSAFKGRAVRYEYRNPRDGHWYYIMATPIADPDGAICKLTLCFDITEKKRAENDLVESQRRISTLMNNLPGIVYRCKADATYSMEFASQGSVKLLGYEPAELLGTGENAYQNIVNPADRKDMLQQVEKSAAAKRPFSFIYRVRAADGQEKWVWEQGEGVFDESGRLVALEGFITDVTAYKEVELDLRKENLRLRSTISERYRFGRIVGKSAPMQEVYDLILKAASSSAGVIIQGESGSGKELVARAIHELSDRQQGAFVPVNCGAIPKNLMEREFFGHLKGAFTGANADRAGFLDTADGGTLFLDEVGEITSEMQVKLLRVLDGLGYTPVGGVKVRKSNFRVVAATNRDLIGLVKAGRIREDFFYRVRILPIHLPPLRERKEDIPLLIDHFLSKHTRQGQSAPQLPIRIREALLYYDWPGNVRELQNALHSYLTLGKLNLMGQITMAESEERDLAPAEMNLAREGLNASMAAIEKQLIIKMLDQTRWHRGRAAAALKLNYKTLQRKMKVYGIIQSKFGT
jgi:PAS domain S-box-containing protein